MGIIISNLINLAIFLSILGVLIVIHELGHFIVARFSGVKVDVFSIGFGSCIYRRNFNDFEFRLCVVPLGGYVKMAGFERDEYQGKPSEYLSKPVGIRSRIVSAGPAVNYFFAWVLFCVVFFLGLTVSSSHIGQLRVGGVVSKYSFAGTVEKVDELFENLAQKGYITREEVLEKDLLQVTNKPEEIYGGLIDKGYLDKQGHITNKFKELDSFSEFKLNADYKNKREKIYSILDRRLEQEGVIKDKFRRLSGPSELEIRPDFKGKRKDIFDILKENVKEYPALSAGLKIGDKIIKVDGRKVDTWRDLRQVIHNSGEGPLDIILLRDGERLALSISPVKEDLKGILGKEKEYNVIGIMASENTVRLKYTLLGSLQEGSVYLLDRTWLTLKALWYVISGELPFKQAFTGPVGIYFITKRAVQVNLSAVIHLVALLSMCLAIFNVLPIPVLDGGHLFFLGIEKIRGKSVSPKIEEIVTKVGVALIIILAVVVFYTDIVRFGPRIFG